MTERPAQEPSREHWHFKKEVQVTHILATLSVSVSVIWYAGKLEQRLALVEQAIVIQKERDATQDATSNEAIDQIRRQLDRMDSKLDRLIEARAAR